MTASPPLPRSSLHARVVLLDAESERAWAEQAGPTQLVEMTPADWRELDARFAALLRSDSVGRVAVSWATTVLGSDEATVRELSSSLRATFGQRLVGMAKTQDAVRAALCSEILGWSELRPGDRLARWEALAGLVPAEQLPRVVIAGGEDCAAAMIEGDRLAVAGVPVGLRTTAEVWERFLESENWDRASTRWRLATVLRQDENASANSSTYRFVAVQAPCALPLLEKARAESGTLAPDETLGDARSAAEALLFAVLDARPLTAGRFRLNALLDFSFGGHAVEGDLAALAARMVVELDGYHHFRSADSYRRDRRKDLLLQQHGWLVLRFLAEDVVSDLEGIVRQIDEAMVRREAAPHSMI